MKCSAFQSQMQYKNSLHKFNGKRKENFWNSTIRNINVNVLFALEFSLQLSIDYLLVNEFR